MRLSFHVKTEDNSLHVDETLKKKWSLIKLNDCQHTYTCDSADERLNGIIKFTAKTGGKFYTL